LVKRISAFFIFISLLISGTAWGTLHYYSGSMNSRFEMRHTYTIIVPAGLSSLTFITTPPDNYSLPNNTQSITERNYQFSVTPSVEDYTDAYGNDFKKLIWTNPQQGTITVTVSYMVSTTSDWNRFVTTDKFPFDSSGLPDSVTDYMKPTSAVQSDHPIFINLVNSLTAGLTTQWEVLKALNGWIMDNIYYGSNPYGYDALSTFALKYGNCSNYAHIALALVRAAGIPARITHGYSLHKPYLLPTAGNPIEADWGEGTHAWIEVYYPSLGWVPYDRQRDLHHVDTHRVLWGRGPDAIDIAGGIFWSFSSVPSGYPRAYQSLSVNWKMDSIALSYIKSTNEVYTKSFSSKVTYIPYGADSDEDLIYDWWEQKIIDYSQDDEINDFNDVLPEDDFDGDNFSNMKEYKKGTDPTDKDSHPPWTMPWLMLLLDD
jgi:transglutaminase-like putative cysteine protease